MTPFASAMQISVRRSSRARARRERTSGFAPSSRRSRTAIAWRTRRALTRELISISTSENALSMRRSAARAARRSWTNHVTAIETAKDNLLRECVKFGALLTEVGYYLGETQGKKGEGLQAWLAENCPEVNYNTAMGYKALAGKCVKMLGGGSQAVAVLQDKTEVVPPGEDAPIEVDSKFIEKRDELFNEVKSRRDLEQTYFKFMASEGKGKAGRPKGTGAGTVEYKKKSSLECAVEAVWPIVQHLLKHRGEMFTAYKILPDEKLIEMRQTLVEHEQAIASVLKTRVE